MTKLITGIGNGLSLAIIISFFLVIIPIEADAQFDSLAWINRYQNHSVTSRDKVFDAMLVNKEKIILTGSTENDYTNFDIASFSLGNNLDLQWKESYSALADYLSDDRALDMTVDSSGSVLIAASSGEVLKRAHDGNIEWTKSFKTIGGTSFLVNFAEIKADTAGNCYLLFGGMVDYSPTGENNTKTVLVKYDKEGNLIWYRKSDICYPRKLIIDAKQDILTVNQGDENWGRVVVIRKFRKNGDPAFEKRYPQSSIEIVEGMLDSESNLWLFSNHSLTDLANLSSSNLLISRYDSLGTDLDSLVWNSEYQLQESVKQVRPFRNSGYLIAMESSSPENGIDHQFVAVDAGLNITGTWRYDGEHHDNDYLVSFDRITSGDIVVTGMSYSDSRNFRPFVYKLKGLSETEWYTVPSIAGDIDVFPKKILVDGSGTVILAGDVARERSDEMGLYTNTNIFVSRFTSSGQELNTWEYINDGKSDIAGHAATSDCTGNVYVSGIEQHGPDFLFPASFYNEDIVIHKYDSDGDIEWQRKIELDKCQVFYVNQFLTGDTLLIVAGEYGSNTPTGYKHKTVLYSLDTDGNRRDSTGFDGTLRFAVQNKNGDIFLVVNNLTIFRYSLTLGRVKDITVHTSDDHISNIVVTDASLFILTSGYNLFRHDFDLNPKWNISLSGHMSVVTSLAADAYDNAFVSGYTLSGGGGQVLKINPDGSVARNIQVTPLAYARKVKPLNNGDLVVTGDPPGGTGNPSADAVLLSPDGTVKKQVTVTSIVKKILEGRDGNIWFIDEHNRFQKYSKDLFLIDDENYFGDDNYKGVDGYGYRFYINDAVLCPDKGLILTGSLGVSFYADLGQFSWNVLTVAKVGSLNRSPVFGSGLLPIAVAGTAYSHQLEAADPDNDAFRFRITSGPVWLKTGENGLLTGTPSASDVGTAEVIIVCYDDYLGETSRTYQLTVSPGGNAITDIEQDGGIVVYPNPSKEDIYVEITFPVTGSLQVSIVDPMGRVIRDVTSSIAPGDTEFRIEREGLVRGSYFLLFRSGEKSFTKLLILK